MNYKMENEMENLSVISELTEQNENVTSHDFQQKQEQIRTLDELKLSELTIDILKDKCKEFGIVGISKFKKPELVSTLLTEFLKTLTLLHLCTFKTPILR